MAQGNGSASPGAPGLLVAETLCARLCDTAGALAADPPKLTARLRLLRAAWAGTAGPLDAGSLIALATGLPDRVRLEAEGLDATATFPPAPARLLVNALLLAAEALPAGGAVAISGDAGSIALLPDGPHAAWPKHAVVSLAGAPPEEPMQVQAWLVSQLAAICGAHASLLLGRADAGPPPLLLSF